MVLSLAAQARLEMDDDRPVYRGMSREQSRVLMGLYKQRATLARDALHWGQEHSSPVVRAVFAAAVDPDHGPDFCRIYAPLKQGEEEEEGEAADMDKAVHCGRRLRELDALMGVTVEGDRTTYALRAHHPSVHWIDYHKRAIQGRPNRRQQALAQSDTILFAGTIYCPVLAKEEAEQREQASIPAAPGTATTGAGAPLGVNEKTTPGFFPTVPPMPAVNGAKKAPPQFAAFADLDVGLLRPILKPTLEALAAIGVARRSVDATQRDLVIDVIRHQYKERSAAWTPLMPRGTFNFTANDSSPPYDGMQVASNIALRYQFHMHKGSKTPLGNVADVEKAFPAPASRATYGYDLTFWQPDTMIGFGTVDIQRPVSHYSWEFARRLAMAGDAASAQQFKLLVEYWRRLDADPRAWVSNYQANKLDRVM